ncbi:hypothetical protein AwPolaro_05860 [Polaromonas sp.]|nr:hypothetical protein AwPolaro_05860 [Polaromonas sp.]
MPSQRINQLLEDIQFLNPAHFELLQGVRKLVLELDRTMTEEVKYGGILFSANKAFCGIFAYSQHVSLEFSAGASLPDPHQILEGAGKLRRHIKLRSLPDAATKRVFEYLMAAYKMRAASA